MSKRDPRVDPRPGDITQDRFGIEFRCTDRSFGMVWFVTRLPQGPWCHGARWPLVRWRKFVSRDTVLHVADVDALSEST